METLVRINFTKRFSPYEDDEKWLDLNNQYADYYLNFEISEHGDLSMVTNLENVFNNGCTSRIIRNIIVQARGFEFDFLYSIWSRDIDSTLIMRDSDIIDIYYNPELSSEDIGKYFLDRDCHNACVMVNFEVWDISFKMKMGGGHIELRDRIMSLFQCSLYNNGSIAVIETRGDDYVRDKIKKICSLYMCEINRNKRGKTIDRYYGFGDIIHYTFMQDDHIYIDVKII